MPNHILVTGPSRSGKSEWAESLAAQSQQAVIYIATAIALQTILNGYSALNNTGFAAPLSGNCGSAPRAGCPPA